MNRWQAFLLWWFKALGGREAEPVVQEKRLFVRHEQPSFLPLDRPFDPMDWERLATMPKREATYFEWLAHRIRELDREAKKIPDTPDGDRARLVYMARRDEVERSFALPTESAEKLVELLQRKEKADRLAEIQKGMVNHGG